jgi:signal transduction histidine kinase
MGNAIKFTYQGYIKVKLVADDGILICDVEDTGLGIK